MFDEKDFETFMRNDNEILRSAHARWMLLSERDPTCETVDATSTIEAKGIYIEQAPLAVGTAAAASNGNGNGAAAVPDLIVAGANVAAEHARVWRDEAGDCWVQDLPGSTGTWINGKLLHKGDKARLVPQVRPARCPQGIDYTAPLSCMGLPCQVKACWFCDQYGWPELSAVLILGCKRRHACMYGLALPDCLLTRHLLCLLVFCAVLLAGSC